MKRQWVISVAAFAAMCLPAFAQQAGAHSTVVARGDTLRMSCAQAQNSVRRPGGTLLNTGADHFDLYHRIGRACMASGDALEPAFVHTKDSPSCFIGYTCESASGD